jgi:hypothetical protein
MKSRQPSAIALTRASHDRLRRRSLKYALLALIAVMWTTGLAFAQDKDVTVTHAVSNFGEPKYPADFSHLDYVNPDAPKGGEISFWSQGNFDSFNNYTRKGVGRRADRRDVRIDPRQYGRRRLWRLLLPLHDHGVSREQRLGDLQPARRRHLLDGTPMTAEDIKFTFELFLEQGITEYRNVVEGFVESVEVLGPHRVKFTFTPEAPRRDVLTFAGGTQVFSKVWFEETGARIDESTLEPFMGTGPYTVESFDVGRQIVYGRSPDFWGADHPLNIGQNTSTGCGWSISPTVPPRLRRSRRAFTPFGTKTPRATGPRAMTSRRSSRAMSGSTNCPTARSGRARPSSSTCGGRNGRTLACARPCA